MTRREGILALIGLLSHGMVGVEASEANITINLDQFKIISLVKGKSTLTITGEDIFNALKGPHAA